MLCGSHRKERLREWTRAAAVFYSSSEGKVCLGVHFKLKPQKVIQLTQTKQLSSIPLCLDLPLCDAEKRDMNDRKQAISITFTVR